MRLMMEEKKNYLIKIILILLDFYVQYYLSKNNFKVFSFEDFLSFMIVYFLIYIYMCVYLYVYIYFLDTLRKTFL